VGRGINFIRRCCGHPEWGLSFRGEEERLGEVFRWKGGNKGNGMIDQLILYAKNEVDTQIRHLLIHEFSMLEHLLTLKKIMLLGQGDFVTALLDAVGPELNKRANQVSGGLEQSKKKRAGVISKSSMSRATFVVELTRITSFCFASPAVRSTVIIYWVYLTER